MKPPTDQADVLEMNLLQVPRSRMDHFWSDNNIQPFSTDLILSFVSFIFDTCSREFPE